MADVFVMLGAGGHAAVLAEVLIRQGKTLLAVVAQTSVSTSSPLYEIDRIETDDKLIVQYSPEQIILVNGVGSLPRKDTRWKLYLRFVELGYRFASVISPKAVVSDYAQLGQGVQVMAGAIIQTGASIGDNTLINSGAIVEHDCRIGCHNHIAPGATLSGGVTTGSRVHIGTGANVIQNITIGDYAVIGAGATLVKDATAGQMIIPAAMRNIS